jgi:hypothetical protein
MAYLRRCTCCREGERIGAPLYWLRGSETFIFCCDPCFQKLLAAGSHSHAPSSLLAALERMVDELLEDLQ